VFIRLVCPISFASAFSFFNLLNLNVKQGVGLFEFVPQITLINLRQKHIDSYQYAQTVKEGHVSHAKHDLLFTKGCFFVCSYLKLRGMGAL
jgi:hypothetical protein